jgi:hypothetical protein
MLDVGGHGAVYKYCGFEILYLKARISNSEQWHCNITWASAGLFDDMYHLAVFHLGMDAPHLVGNRVASMFCMVRWSPLALRWLVVPKPQISTMRPAQLSCQSEPDPALYDRSARLGVACP